jgi:hypothetical protein
MSKKKLPEPGPESLMSKVNDYHDELKKMNVEEVMEAAVEQAEDSNMKIRPDMSDDEDRKYAVETEEETAAEKEAKEEAERVEALKQVEELKAKLADAEKRARPKTDLERFEEMQARKPMDLEPKFDDPVWLIDWKAMCKKNEEETAKLPRYQRECVRELIFDDNGKYIDFKAVFPIDLGLWRALLLRDNVDQRTCRHCGRRFELTKYNQVDEYCKDCS